jgi:alpha,alpha-trehalose phosphorylase
MLHHERLRRPLAIIRPMSGTSSKKRLTPETMLALGNGYFGVRGCPEEGGPYAENGTFIKGFYETRPIVYGEDA